MTSAAVAEERDGFEFLLLTLPVHECTAAQAEIGSVRHGLARLFRLAEDMEFEPGQGNSELWELEIQRLNRAFEEFRDRLWTARGPTVWPGINLLVQFAREAREGQRSSYEVQALARDELNLLQDLLGQSLTGAALTEVLESLAQGQMAAAEDLEDIVAALQQELSWPHRLRLAESPEEFDACDTELALVLEGLGSAPEMDTVRRTLGLLRQLMEELRECEGEEREGQLEAIEEVWAALTRQIDRYDRPERQWRWKHLEDWAGLARQMCADQGRGEAMVEFREISAAHRLRFQRLVAQNQAPELESVRTVYSGALELAASLQAGGGEALQEFLDHLQRLQVELERLAA